MDERKKILWELAIAQKLKASALAARRFDSVNYYAKCIEALELRAKRELMIFPRHWSAERIAKHLKDKP